jgi:hypothetical protein
MRAQRVPALSLAVMALIAVGEAAAAQGADREERVRDLRARVEEARANVERAKADLRGAEQALAEATGKPAGLTAAEASLLGTWVNTADTQSVPKLDVLIEGDVLKVRLWGRTHPQDSPFGPPDPLHVLSPYADGFPPPEAQAVAFSLHKADFALVYTTLRVRDGRIHLEQVKIFTDGSGRANRMYHATFAKG